MFCTRHCTKVLILMSITALALSESDYTKPYITNLHVTTDIKFHFATTLVTSILLNPLERSTEASLDITLPNAAFISNFTLEIDGKVYPASVKEKEAAKKEYEKAKKKGQSAGHVAARPRETNKFNVQVNVAGKSVVVFNLTYQEILHRRLGAYESVLYIDPGQLVEDMKIQVYIEESRPLRFLQVPPLKNELLSNTVITEQNKLAIVDRPSPKQAYILFQPTLAQQSEKSSKGISALFTVRYDVERDYDAGDLLVVNGYFIHFIAPEVPEYIPKDIVFILDKSGSMSGTKINQLKDAMRVILEDLQEGDRFNLVMFSSDLALWKEKLVRVNKKTIQKGLTFVRRQHAGGYTNINKALMQGLTILQSGQHNDSLPIVMFLSDGQATSGVTEPTNILFNAQSLNKDGMPIYSLAFGKDADWDLSKKLSLESGALARRIYEDADATLQMTNFYQELATTLLTNVKVKYLEDQVEPGSLTTSEFRHFFNGSEMIVAGKLSDSAIKLTVDVEANSVEGPIKLQVENDISDLPSASSLTSLSDVQTITEKMWAYLSIKQLIKQMDESKDSLMKSELKTKATQLSLKYNFVTPLTSMVVTKPDEDSIGDFEQDDELTDESEDDHDPSTGYAGGDPHFMISIRSMPYPLCFDVKSQAGKFYRLLKDPVNDLVVNTNMEEGITFSKVTGRPRVLMTQMTIQYKDLSLSASLMGINVSHYQISWETNTKLDLQGILVEVRGFFLRLVLDFGVEVLVSKVIKHTEIPARLDFLNIDIENEDLLSTETSGLIGQFAHRNIHMKEIETPIRRVLADLRIIQNGHTIAKGTGVKVIRNNFVINKNKTCIQVDVPTQLFDVNAELFLVPHLLSP